MMTLKAKGLNGTVNIKSTLTPSHLTIAMLAVLATACSSDTRVAGDSDSSSQSVGADATASVAPSTVSGAGGVSSSAEIDQPATDNLGVRGEGMPYLYDTGYHVDTITITPAGGESNVIQFVTDMENNVIQEIGGPNNFDDFWYDEQGRVASFGLQGASVSYNNDGTIRSTSSRSADGATLSFDEYAYADGKIQSVGSRSVAGNSEAILGGAIYNYATDGALFSSRTLTNETRQATDIGYDFIVNSDGLIASAQRVPVGDFDIQFTPEFIFFTFDYDENRNLIKVENFSNEGELIKTVDFTYLPNSEAIPNIAGFMLITEKHFREVFEAN